MKNYRGIRILNLRWRNYASSITGRCIQLKYLCLFKNINYKTTNLLVAVLGEIPIVSIYLELWVICRISTNSVPISMKIRANDIFLCFLSS